MKTDERIDFSEKTRDTAVLEQDGFRYDKEKRVYRHEDSFKSTMTVFEHEFSVYKTVNKELCVSIVYRYPIERPRSVGLRMSEIKREYIIQGVSDVRRYYQKYQSQINEIDQYVHLTQQRNNQLLKDIYHFE